MGLTVTRINVGFDDDGGIALFADGNLIIDQVGMKRCLQFFGCPALMALEF